jgi:hypothetical protein
MFRFLLRTLGVLCLGAAFALFVYDATRSIAGDSFLYTNTAEAWTLLDAASLQRVQLFVRGNFWEALAATVLDAPAFIVLGSLGAISIAFGTKKSRSTGIHPAGRWFRALSRRQPLAGGRNNKV